MAHLTLPPAKVALLTPRWK